MKKIRWIVIGLTNVTRRISDADNNAFSELDLAVFQNEGEKARKYCLQSKDEKEDDFLGAKVRVNKLKIFWEYLMEKWWELFILFNILREPLSESKNSEMMMT